MDEGIRFDGIQNFPDLSTEVMRVGLRSVVTMIFNRNDHCQHFTLHSRKR